ncbi:MAG: thioredoxin domain-containing protein [Bacteriovoracaceae bacterium]|nr:thioredoxin domain-containing protein [Bacteriovoracaceae bacterium]
MTFMKKEILLSMLVVFGIFQACSKSESKSGFKFVTAKDQTAAAKNGAQNITYKDITSGIEADVYELEKKIFDLKMENLKQIVMKNIIEGDKNSKGLTQEQYIEKYVVNGIKISPKDIENFIKEKKIPDAQITEEIKGRIKTYMEMEGKQKKLEDWLNGKLAKSPVEVYMNKPSRPFFKVEYGNSPRYGKVDAPVTIVEFSDFQCPHCSTASDTIKLVKEKFKDKVSVVYKNFPLPFHTQARTASLAALCGHEQKPESFWKFHDHFFANQDKLSLEEIQKVAKDFGVDGAKLKECVDSQKFSKAVDADIEQGKIISVKSTPTFFVNGKLVSGAQPLEVFAELIEEELSNVKK